MPYPNTADFIDMLVATAGGNVVSPWTSIGNPSALGLFVPALGSASTVTLQAALTSDGTNGAGFVDKSGAAVLVLPSSSGGFHVSSSEMAAALAYPYIRVVLGTHQAADVTFKLVRKVTGSDPTV